MACGPRPPAHTLQSDSRRTDDDDGDDDGDDDPLLVTDYDCVCSLSGRVVGVVIVCLLFLLLGSERKGDAVVYLFVGGWRYSRHN